MDRRIVISLAGAVVLAAGLVLPTVATAAAGEVCDPTGVVEDPAEFVWTDAGDHHVGVLEYGEATFSIAGETLTTRAYRQEGGCFSIPGPTMLMEPGNRYVVRFRNLLDHEPASAVHNDFKDPNVTNLHTHGLHISGEAPADDVTRMFEGGRGGDYLYDIPADHMGGTYWYHAHHHGSTFLQVSTGGFGLIVIDDAGDGQVPANVTAMAERQVLVGYLDPGAAGTGGDQLVSGTLPAGWTVNGTVGGTITMPPDTWEHWRVLLADRDARMKTVSLDGGCEAKLLARDGVWRTVAPGDLPANAVALTGASRADLAVRCAGPATLAVDGTPVASIDVAGPSDPGPHPYAEDGVSTWSADRPAYLRDLRDVRSVNAETVRMGARTVNGDQFDLDVPTFTLTADAVQEWTIRGATNHPFHLHVYHFQATTDCGAFEAGEYYDTIASNCTVRFDLDAATSSPYEGRTIMHCHILEHEDQGAMTWMDVVGGAPPPTYPPGHGYSEYYLLDGTPPPGSSPAAPSGLTATATTASSVDLTWDDNATDETGFTVQRSLDGSTFADVATLGADTTAWTDAGVEADTQYWYRVLAFNESGTSAWSDPVSVTTPPDTGGGTLDVSVLVTTVNAGGGQKAGAATVTVVGPGGGPVAGATVTGYFTGTFEESGVTGTTGTDGTATMRTSATAKGKVEVTFCVTDVTHPSHDPWSGPVCASG